MLEDVCASRSMDIGMTQRYSHLIGSTTVYPRSDERARPIELGAWAFSDGNRNLIKAAEVRVSP